MEITTNKAESLYQYLVYTLATGKWLPGDRLPSVREAEQTWGVHRLTILGVYKQLCDKGLLESRPRYGYVVSESPDNTQLSKHRASLERIYSKVTKLIEDETDMLPSAVLTYIYHLSDIRLSESPDIVFVECSNHQASCHANELSKILKMPVASQSTEDFATRAGNEFKIVITTVFHIDEVNNIAKNRQQEVFTVAIEVAKELKSIDNNTQLQMIATPEFVYDNIYNDLQKMLPKADLSKLTVENVNTGLTDVLNDTNDESIFLLAPLLWANADNECKKNPRVLEIIFQINKESLQELLIVLPIPVTSF